MHQEVVGADKCCWAEVAIVSRVMAWRQLNNTLVAFLVSTLAPMAIEVGDSAKSSATVGAFKWSGINLIK